VVRAGGVGPYEPGPTDATAGDQSDRLGALDLPVHGRVGGPQSLGQVGDAELELRLAEHEGEQLALLPGPQDREQRGRR
jgi:hypothetical protein